MGALDMDAVSALATAVLKLVGNVKVVTFLRLVAVTGCVSITVRGRREGKEK